MGSVFSYSGLSAKLRAMQAKLTSEEQFQEIARLGSVPEIVSYLKKTPEYQKRWASVDEQDLHRGNVEELLNQSVFQNYTKIYHFANPKQRDFLALYFKRYEIYFIKQCMSSIFDHRNISTDISTYLAFYRRHSKLDIQRMSACSTIGELLECLKGSEYYQPLSGIADKPGALMFDYGMALDLYFFHLVWKIRKKLFRGNDLAEITKAYGREFDLLNLQWIYRSKKYYQMDATEIYSLLIPVNYKLKRREIQALVESADIEEFQRLLTETYYGTHFERLDSSTLESYYIHMLRNTLQSEARKDPYSVAILYSYLYQKAQEVDRLTTVIECVRYGMRPEETMELIHAI